MEKRQTLHIIGGSSRSRAEQARLGFALGHHCEIYADASELMQRPPVDGVVLVRDKSGQADIARVLDALASKGMWLPVVATARDPSPGRVVRAIKAGALDYLRLPLNPERLIKSMELIMAEAQAHAAARRRMVEARRRIAQLSPREREVLDWLAEGCSNKMIARELHISPRTVEIHRANMMHKLGAEHPAHAVRMVFDAHVEEGDDERLAPE